MNRDYIVYFTTRTGHRQLTVSAPSEATAKMHVKTRFPGAIIGNAILVPSPKVKS